MGMKEAMKDFWWYAFTSEGRDTRTQFWPPMMLSVAIWLLICGLLWWLDEQFYSPGEGMSIGILFFCLPTFFILFWACSSGITRRLRDIGFSEKWYVVIQITCGILYLPSLVVYIMNGFKQAALSDTLFQLAASGFFIIMGVLLLLSLLPTNWALKRK